MNSILSIKNLEVGFDTPRGLLQAVRGVDVEVPGASSMGIVGESGSGKTVMCRAAMGLLRGSNVRRSGSVVFDGDEIGNLDSADVRRYFGTGMAMIFQDPMTSLNPYLTVERQMTEVLELHKGMTRKEARVRAVQLLDAVKIPDAAKRIGMYPHEFSGGMRQRVMIAMALLCEPEVLIADEPTTALDVTVQAQILALLRELQRDFGTAIVMITHDLGVVAGLCDEVLVLYGGRVMEQGDAKHIFHHAAHPYTLGLLNAIPRMDADDQDLIAIPGAPPNMARMPKGCPFSERCSLADQQCVDTMPELKTIEGEHMSLRACHRDIAIVKQSLPQEPAHV